MARDATARDTDSEQSLLDRRSYLKLTGAAMASVAAAGASSDSANAASYDTITVPAGGTETIQVGSGETFENTLIDMTADGASAQIIPKGDDWTVRNVAFKGNHPGGNYLLTPGVSSKDGHGLIENVYMGDGQTEGSDMGGVWVNGNLPHRGTITFRNVHIAHMIDNGLYGMDSGYWGYGGVVNVEDSYFDSNNIANIRVGSIDGRTCHVKNCVVKADSTRACREGCSSPGAKNSRGVWAWFGPVEVTGSDVGGSSPRVTKDGGHIEESDTRWGSEANVDRVPEGAPMSPEEAIGGGQ
jgi:hypothetical protein